MTTPRSAKGIRFPVRFEKNGRTGRISHWKKNNVFGTYFRFAGAKHRNSFKTFEAAREYLDAEFSKLDTDQANSLALNPIRHDLKTYGELEQLLRERGNGATLREAVEFYLVYREHKKFTPRTVSECIRLYQANQKERNVAPSELKSSARHLRHFEKTFGARKIHDISTLEISNWLTSFRSADGEPWSVKTRRNVRGTLVSLSLFCQDTLGSIPDLAKTPFQRVKNPRKDERAEVEIYTPDEISKLLKAAVEHNPRLIPPIVFGCFAGLRPDETHAENAKRSPLKWSAIHWEDKRIYVMGQKVRSKGTRDIPLHPVAEAWLSPFKVLSGQIWNRKKSYDECVRTLHRKAKVSRYYDGFRHSYASYRIRQLKGNRATVAEEMGNSPSELVNSYRRTVTDKQSEDWFSVMPPGDYKDKLAPTLSRSA